FKLRPQYGPHKASQNKIEAIFPSTFKTATCPRLSLKSNMFRIISPATQAFLNLHQILFQL
ncbi:hypothetical protein TorRG33x02_075550, partial [Trema orientale]